MALNLKKITHTRNYRNNVIHQVKIEIIGMIENDSLFDILFILIFRSSILPALLSLYSCIRKLRI